MPQIAFTRNEVLSVLGSPASIISFAKSLRTTVTHIRHTSFGSGLFNRIKSNLVQQDKMISPWYFNVKHGGVTVLPGF